MDKIENKDKVRLGVTIGDVNGIGLEVIIKTFMDPRILDLCTPIVYGSSKITSYHRKTLNINDFSFNIVSNAAAANPKRANIINCWNEDVKIELGYPTKTAGEYALKSLEYALEDLMTNKIDALVTAPINKHTIQSDSFNFSGHTEFIAEKFNAAGNELMLMVSNKVRIGVITGHISLADVPKMITEDLIIKKIKILNNSLINDFGIRKPRIAILSLNPHAGDNGLMGDEEKTIIIPALDKAKNNNYLVFGPYPADGFFGSLQYSHFDGILAMYHDQGLIPFKTLAFESGVNYTAGLPFVRTSPSHGTAYEIAGKNEASETSFREAVYTACDIFSQRKQNKALKANSMDKVH